MNNGVGMVTAVCTSVRTGERKKEIDEGRLVAGHGLEGDAHAGPGHRQVSLLAEESIEKMRARGLDVGAGDFAENLTTRGLDLCSLPVGTWLRVGVHGALLQISQIGKVCHQRSAIYHQAGDCVMPREGVFAEVRTAGRVRRGDPIAVVPEAEASVGR